MKDEKLPLVIKTLILIGQLEGEFLELTTLLRKVQEMSPKHFETLMSIPQLGRRKAYYLVSIDKAFGDKKLPPERLTKIGWTKLGALAPHVTDENPEDVLLFAELNTVKNIEAVVHGLDRSSAGGVSS